MRSAAAPIRVLVIDDSAVVRLAFSQILADENEFQFVAAPDAIIGAEKMKRCRPDVIVLDLDLPRVDGLTFLQRVMSTDPLPVIICSGVARKGTMAAMRALEHGAIEVVEKPNLGIRDFLSDVAGQMQDLVRAAAGARVTKRSRLNPPSRHNADVIVPRSSNVVPAGERIVAIGASTGGTQALTAVLAGLPRDSPGVAIVQHMPGFFTGPFAERLNQLSPMRVSEAHDGQELPTGCALVAPGGRHMIVRRTEGTYRVHLSDGPPVSRHRPSVDVLFRSVAQAAGSSAVGVLLTGMGDDGAAGLLEMREQGASTLVQDEESCAVFGMPREAIARGAAEEIVALHDMSSAILRRLRTT